MELFKTTATCQIGESTMVRYIKQHQYDEDRVFYELNHPQGLEQQQVLFFLRAISTSLKKGGGLVSGVETFVFETVATDRGIKNVMGVKQDAAGYVINQLRTHLPGLRAEPINREYADQISYAVEIGMTNPMRTLHIPDGRALSHSILASIQALKPGEIVVLQWVVTPAKIDSVKRDWNGNVQQERAGSLKNWVTALSMAPFGEILDTTATSDEIKTREAKFVEPNVQAIGRVGTYSPNPARVGVLVGPVVTALRSAKSTSTSFRELPAVFRDVVGAMKEAATPSKFSAQLNAAELSAVIGWPLGQPHVAGLPQGSARHLPATEVIPREGRVLGTSNFPGGERPIAVGREESLTHCHIMGPTGVGKTTLLANLVRQDMVAGYGVIVMESKGDLFNTVINYVPPERIKDVIILNVGDFRMPIGFNVLDQGTPRVVIDQMTDLFQSLYPDTRGVWVRELLYHGLYTLSEEEGMTFVDLAALISPRTPDEVAWATGLRKSVQNKELREFWDRWEGMKPDERDRNAAPLHNRIWQLVSRPELRNIIGQSKSSFQMDDVLRENKILLINLQGVPKEAASLAGTLIMNAVWTSAKKVSTETPNYIFLDEFQDFIRLPIGAEEMLAKARKFRLGMTLAHQHLSQLSDDVKSAVISNARTKLYFQTSPEDAKVVQRSLGSNSVTEYDLQQLGAYEAVARIATASGSSSPVSLMTHPPRPFERTRDAVIRASRDTYGRPVEEIDAEITGRRKGKGKGNRPPIGWVSDDE